MDYSLLRKTMILYLVITQTLINCQIKIYPDNYAKDDVLFETSQVKGKTNERFYYSLGYFTNKSENYYSSKYGIFFEPIQCSKKSDIESTLSYNNNDQLSFFSSSKVIFDPSSTLTGNNYFEETKLFRNTITGKNFMCPFPVKLFHSKDFEIILTIPIISMNDEKLDFFIHNEDYSFNQKICDITLKAKIFKKFLLIINANNNFKSGEEVTMTFNYEGNSITIKANETSNFYMDFLSDEGEIILSNYRVTIEDKKIKTGNNFTPDLIRSKRGLNECDIDEDCFLGFMCDGANCIPCHSSCLKCTQDYSYPDSKNYCKECNSLSTTLMPKESICEIGYVDLSEFEDFDVKIAPDGKDFNHRETLGFWVFFADSENAKDNLYHVILRDRFVISINLIIEENSKKAQVFCHAFEDLFRLKTSDTLKINDYIEAEGYCLNITIPSEAQNNYMKENSIDIIDGHWIHISCAESFDHELFYLKTVINGQKEYKEEHLKHETFYNDSNYIIENDKYFYHIINDGDYLTLSFRNFGKSLTKIYLRNLQLFKEYIPVKMDYMYFIFKERNNFYELLYQIPFDYLYYGTTYKINGFEYDGTKTEIVLTIKNNLKVDVSPPLNFKRLNLLEPNKKYREIDLVSTEVDDLYKTDNQQKYLYNDGEALCCEKYLDYETNKCSNTCINFDKLPFTGVSLSSGYCDYSCSQSMSCNEDHPSGMTLDYKGGFCKPMSNIYNLFFRCEDDEIEYYLQFSGFYNSAEISKTLETPLKSYIIEFWIYLDYFLFSMENSYFQNTNKEKNFFFHSNVLDAYFNFDPKYALTIDNQIQTESITFDRSQTDFRFVEKEWNKFVIYTKFDKEKNTYNKNVYINYYMMRGFTEYIETTGQLKTISFCEKTCLDWRGEKVHWATAYYKNLRIWDGENASENLLEQYDQFYPSIINRVSAIKYYFPLSNWYISNNKIIDPKTGESFDVKIGKYYLRKYNFSSKFDIVYSQHSVGICKYPEEKNGKFEKKCKPGCDRCWCNFYKEENCFSCRPGFYLKNKECNTIRQYYFKSPNLLGTNLDAEIVKITEIENKDAITVTFWLKVIGFSADDQVKIIKLGNNLEIYYSSTYLDKDIHPYGLSLICDNKLIANDPKYREEIGKWVFFSIAYHREKSSYGTRYFPSMMKFELNSNSYEINTKNINTNMGLDKFTIYKEFFGLICDLKFYDEYIIQSLAFEKKLQSLKTPFYIPVEVISFFPKSKTNKGCFQTSYLNGANSNDYECVPDEDPNSTTNSCSECFNLCTNPKIKSFYDTCSCVSKNYNSQMIIRNSDRNSCRTFDFINFANCNKITIEPVPTARETKRYTMQFWMYAYNYIDGRFGGVTFYWKGHNKIIVSKGNQIDGNNKYEFKCIPYATDDSEANISLKEIIEINKWNYLSCAVDFVDVNYYINVNTQLNEIILTKANLLATSPTDILKTKTETILTITDNTVFNDWGLLFFKQIRLWKWSYFNAEFLSRIEIKTHTLFPYLLAQWHPKFPNIKGDNYFNNFIVTELISRKTFTVVYNGIYGMNVIDEYYYPEIVLCDEDGKYYDVATESCIQFVDLSKMKDINFKEIPCAYSGSYSMGFWIFVEDSSILSTGLHINWSSHLQITIIRTSRLQGYCFPQGYYSDSVSNENIAFKYSNALNAAEVYLVNENTSESGTWIWVICAMSHYKRKYYINGMDENTLVENELKKETLYQDEKGKIVYSYYPMRYYFSNTGTLTPSSLAITKITNTRKIYFRSLSLFRDYIPFWYSSNIRYMNLKDLENDRMFSLLFFCNFAEYSLTSKNMKYMYQYRDKNAKNYKIVNMENTMELANDKATWELSANFRFLPLCEFGTKVKKKYDPDKNLCVFITSCDLTALNAYYCMEENTPLCCLPNYYITKDFSGQIYCSGGCIIEKLRQPGTHETQGICNTPCADGNQVCPGSGSALLSDYITNFSCQSDRYRIGYYCVDKTLDIDSALFFSKCYNSPNFYVSINDENKFKFKTGYFYEFWFKLDNILNECRDGYKTEDIEYYLYSEPHSIYFQTSTNLFYYKITNTIILEEPISSVSENEWNKVIIKTTLNEGQNVYIYLNYDIENPKVKITNIENKDMQLNNIGFCSREGNGRCANKNINWGSAYYKNIRIWDLRTSTIQLLQDFNNQIFTEKVQSLILFYPLTIQYLDINKITEEISDKDSILVTHSETNDFMSSDKNIFYNYEINFDWGKDNPNYFISALDKSEDNYGYITSTACHKYCKRCYSGVNTNCYECNVGYILVGMECKVVNGYFLKIPANSVGAKIPFKIEKGTIKVVDLKAFTFCIYMKFEGILTGASSQSKIMNFREDTYLAYEVSSTNLIFIIGSTEAFRDKNFNKYFGIWIPICIANYISGPLDNEIYPNMITLSVNKKDIPFSPGYSIPKGGVTIDQISLHYEVVAFFADFRIYDRFIQGNFGTIISETAQSKNLLIYYELSGVDSCIQADQLTTSEIVSVNCVADYNIYVDSSRKCIDETFYFDYSLDSLEKPCSFCKDICVTMCFNPETEDCTCDMTNGLFWLRRHKTEFTTFCEYIPYIDYSVLNDIEISVPSSATYESTLELWFFAYSYNLETFNFKEINIDWHLHNKIKVYSLNNELFAQCYALWDNNDKNRYTEYIEQKIITYKWNILRCGSEYISRYHKYFFNSIEKNLITEDYPIDRIGQVSKLKIYNGLNSYDSYGYVFLREIKLWQQYNSKYIDSSFIDLKSYGLYSIIEQKSAGIFPGLIAFIKSDFDSKDFLNVKNSPHKYKIINLLGDDDDVNYLRTWTVTRRTDFIGYNIVDPFNTAKYKDLTLCEEGEVYNESSDTCIKPVQTHCEYPGDIGDKCITCPEETIYLSPVDGTCTNICPSRFYPREDMNECRACHWTCYECFGPFENQCTACKDLLDSNPALELNLVPNLNICIEDCEDYGLTKSPITPHLCVIFDADAELVNYSEDIPININNFNRLEARVINYTSKDYSTRWRFDGEKTKEINNDTTMIFPTDTPFYDLSTITNLSTLVNQSFFKEGKKYVVILDIISENEEDPSKSVSIPVSFTLQMNSAPINGKLTIIPEIGLYNTTTFVISCIDWFDDTTNELLYKFYYQEKGTKTVYNLRDWDYINEIISNFTVSYYALDSSIITIYCQIRDNYDAITTVSQDIIVANSLKGGVFDLSSALSKYKLPEKRTELIYYRRSHYLMSLGINSYKILQPNLLQTKYELSIDKSKITKTDPTCTLDYCNYNGICDLIDEFIVCHCNTGFLGRNCHIDKKGYQKLEDYYNELFNKLIGELQSNISYYQFEVIHNLYFGASQFFQDTKFFSLSLDTFLRLALDLYGESIMNNTAEYIDLLDYYYSYELMRMEQSKAKTKNSTGLKYRNITLNNENINEYKNAFTYIHEELLVFSKYLAEHYKITGSSFTYESRNFYLNIAPITPNFNVKEFFQERKSKYRTYVEFMNCINFIEIEKLLNKNFYLYLIFIEYYYFPYGYNNSLLENKASPLIEIKLMDTSTGKYLSINGCNGRNAIIYYLPYASYIYLDIFNYQKSFYDPNQYKNPNDPIFADPIYIEDNGHVTNITLEERIEKYNRLYNISPKFYDESAQDFFDTGIYYLNFTNDTNFIVFNSTHLTQFSSFFIQNNATFITNSRFFYLLRPKIFLYFQNYKESLGGIIFLSILFLYFIFLIILQNYDKKFLSQECLLDYIKEQIVEIFLHYKKEKQIMSKKIIPNRLNQAYDYRNFWNNRRIEPVGFGGVSTSDALEGKGFFGENRKKNNYKEIEDKEEKYLENDEFKLNLGGKNKKNNFFEGENVVYKTKNPEEELKRYNRDLPNINKERFNPNNLPRVIEDKEKANEIRLQEFADICLTSCEFFSLNFKNRNLIINSFCIVSLFHPRWKKLTLLITEIGLMMLFISIFLTSNEKVLTFSFSLIISYSLLSELLTNSIIYILSFLFNFPYEKEKRLFDLVTIGGQLALLKEWEIINKIQKVKSIIGCIICSIIVIISFYITFGFTIVWKIQRWAFLICFVFCFIFNFIVFEFLIEIFIAIFYSKRKHSCCMRGFSELLNRIRNHRCLSP